jgi:hypothetical protein
LSKYYYKPILEKVKESYLENAKIEFETNVDIESDVRLIVEANSEDESYSARIGFVDIRMWELEKVED